MLTVRRWGTKWIEIRCVRIQIPGCACAVVFHDRMNLGAHREPATPTTLLPIFLKRKTFPFSRGGLNRLYSRIHSKQCQSSWKKLLGLRIFTIIHLLEETVRLIIFTKKSSQKRCNLCFFKILPTPLTPLSGLVHTIHNLNPSSGPRRHFTEYTHFKLNPFSGSKRTPHP